MRTNNVYLFRLSMLILIFLLCRCEKSVDKRPISINENDAPVYFMEIRYVDSVEICWDAPTIETDSVDYYVLSCSSVSQVGWRTVKENIPASSEPNTIIYRNELNEQDSLFYFRIHYITKSGLTSAPHFTTDESAVPSGGWFLIWK